MSSSGMGRDIHSFTLSIKHSLCLQGAMKDGFGEAVVACDMPEPCKFPSPDNCHKRFLWTHKEVDLASHRVVGLVLQTGSTEKLPRSVGIESLDPFVSESASKVHVSQP